MSVAAQPQRSRSASASSSQSSGSGMTYRSDKLPACHHGTPTAHAYLSAHSSATASDRGERFTCSPSTDAAPSTLAASTSKQPHAAALQPARDLAARWPRRRFWPSGRFEIRDGPAARLRYAALRGCPTPSLDSPRDWSGCFAAAASPASCSGPLSAGSPGRAGWSSLGFTGLWSLHVETTYNTAHIFHMANMLLVIQAIWITADAPLIKQAPGRRHVLADAARAALGLARVDRLHRHLSHGRGPLEARLQRPRLGQRHVAANLDVSLGLSLVAHDAADPQQPHVHARAASRHARLRDGRHPRALPAAAAVDRPGPRSAFYAGVLATFDYGFQFNALFTALYLLPLRGVDHVGGAAEARNRQGDDL